MAMAMFFRSSILAAANYHMIAESFEMIAATFGMNGEGFPMS
jgi:hypothetical protein